MKSLIKEVNDAAYQDIDDVVAFVKWLDDELCFLVRTIPPNLCITSSWFNNF